jgi:2-dehydro-3-deoxy-D-gluconate 5-dehydrogenase
MADERPRKLAGKVAVVTGASRGIGRAVAESLAEAGGTVVLVGRQADSIEAVASELARDHGSVALPVVADISDDVQVEALAQRVVSTLGSVDVLVNNSGFMVEGTFLDVSQEDFDRVIATNLRGTVLCCRAFGQLLTGQERGKVINIASNLGLAAVPGASSYCSSKAAVIGLTKALALEWARFNVQVNAVAPGFVETDMNAELRTDTGLYKKILSRIPARRFAAASEVGDLVCHLAGSSSDFITGECIVIDGGQLAMA